MIRGVVKLPSKDQISAAQELYRDEKMEYWRLEDETMARLRDQDSNMREQATTLIKATLVNSFYGARAGSRAIDNITSWLVAKEPDILREYHDLIDNEEVRIQFVQQIATYGRDKDI